jgi:hypothetical protein
MFSVEKKGRASALPFNNLWRLEPPLFFRRQLEALGFLCGLFFGPGKILH